MRIGLIITLVAMLISGCAVNSGGEYYQISQPVTIATDGVKVVAKDFYGKISERYAPGSTTFVMNHKSEPVAVALESLLRNEGYAVSADPEESGAKIGVIMDSLDNERVLVRLVVGDSFQVNRLYKLLNDNNLQAVSGFTVRDSNEG